MQATGKLTAGAPGNVFVSAGGVLTVNNVNSTPGEDPLTVTGTASTAADLILATNGSIVANNGPVFLTAGNAIQTGAGSLIKSGLPTTGTTVTLTADTNQDAADSNPFRRGGTITGKLSEIDD